MPDIVQYRTISGSITARVEDGTDPGHEPDIEPMTGTVTFTPELTGGKMVAFPGTGQVIYPKPVECTLQGGLIKRLANVGGAETWVDPQLFVTVDDRADQTGWHYRMSFKVMQADQSVEYQDRRVVIEAGDGDLDIATLIASATVVKSPSIAPIALIRSVAEEVVDEHGGGGGMPAGIVPIFPTLAEAQAWEAANPGRTALTLEGSADPDPIIPPAPTMDDVADTYTIPDADGVEYLVGGSVVETGTYSVGDVDQTITVTARATGGRPLEGETIWPLVFTRSSDLTVIAQTGFNVPDTTDVESIPLTEPAGGTLVKGGDYALAVESGRLIKRVGTGVNHGGSLTISSPANVPGIRTVRFTLGYDLTAGTSAAPGFNFQWKALFNGNPSSAVMQVQVRREPDGTLDAAGAGSRVTDVQTLVGTIPASGVMVVTVGTAQVTVEVDGTEVVSAAIASTYTLDPEQTPRVELLATTPALDSLLIEAGT